MKPQISVYSDRPAEFWITLGPFFANPSVRREMPYLRDAAGYVWFVARKGGELLGFASTHVDNQGVGHLHGLYVLPDYRTNGVAAALIDARLAWLRDRGVQEVRTTANALSAPLLLKAGFEAKGAKGRYQLLERAL